MSGSSRSDLETIGDRLEQAEAILAYEGALSRRLFAVRKLLSGFDSAVLPTRGMRKRWIGVLETILKLDHQAATAAEVADVVRQIQNLRRAVRAHEADISS